MTRNERKKNMASFSIRSFQGDILTVETNEAHPPGYRMELVFEPGAPSNPVKITGKVISVQRESPGQYSTTISLKVHSLKKTDRDALLDHIAQKNDAGRESSQPVPNETGTD